MLGQTKRGRLLDADEAAHRLGVEPAAVRMFVQQRLLRPAATEPLVVPESEVLLLKRLMLSRTVSRLGASA